MACKNPLIFAITVRGDDPAPNLPQKRSGSARMVALKGFGDSCRSLRRLLFSKSPLCGGPVGPMCLTAGRSSFLSSRLVRLAAALNTVLISCRFALILFRPGRAGLFASKCVGCQCPRALRPSGAWTLVVRCLERPKKASPRGQDSI